jgi:ferredoxin
MLGQTNTTMPNLTERLPANIAGAYYVDSTCIDCGLCHSIATAFFSRDDESSFSMVHRQPVLPEEIELAEEARLSCPTESIGNDGQAGSEPASPVALVYSTAAVPPAI